MKKKFKILLVLIMFISLPVYASAKDLFVSDNNVNVKTNMDGTSFIAGNNVDVENKVNGILFTAGNTLSVSSESDYLFAAGNSTRLDEIKTKDAFIAGSSVAIIDSKIERDVYIAGSSVNLSSDVGRNVYIASGTAKISGNINGNITIDASTIVIDSSTNIKGTLKYNENANIDIRKGAYIGNKETLVVNTNNTNIDNEVTFISKITSLLLSFVNKIIIGLLLMLFIPKLFEKISKMSKENIISNLGFGLISLIFIPIVSLIFICTIVGMSVGFILLILYFLSIYLSTILSGYYVFKMLFNKKIKNEYLLLILGTLSIYLLKLIPFVGTLISICSLCLGLGVIFNLIFKRSK